MADIDNDPNICPELSACVVDNTPNICSESRTSEAENDPRVCLESSTSVTDYDPNVFPEFNTSVTDIDQKVCLESSTPVNDNDPTVRLESSTTRRQEMCISDEELQRRVRALEGDLTGIFNGTLPNLRHKRYSEGGKSRREYYFMGVNGKPCM